jgi:hypothetical protein
MDRRQNAKVGQWVTRLLVTSPRLLILLVAPGLAVYRLHRPARDSRARLYLMVVTTEPADKARYKGAGPEGNGAPQRDYGNRMWCCRARFGLTVIPKAAKSLPLGSAKGWGVKPQALVEEARVTVHVHRKPSSK